MKYSIDKQDITHLPLADLYRESKTSCDVPALVETFAKFWNLKNKPWFVSQLTAYFAKHYPAVKVNGKYNLQATLKTIDDFGKGCYLVAVDNARTNYVQNMAKATEYSSLVPLILSSYKKYDNINYSEWDTLSIKQGMHSDLYDCIEHNHEKYGCDEVWLYLSEQQASSAELRNPDNNEDYTLILQYLRSKMNVTESHVIKVKGTPFEDQPRLIKYMLLQGWVAHPKLRNKYMILDPYSFSTLDNIPPPLVAIEKMFDRLNSENSAKADPDLLPWMA